MKNCLRVLVVTLFMQTFLLWPVHGEQNGPSRHILNNGMSVILLENHRAPVVTIQAWVGAGSLTEGEFSASGISHFVEHMLFKGTERRSVGQICREVKEAGVRTNAYTGQDKTVYYITFHSDHYDKALDIMADILMHSVFDPEEVETERAVVIKEIEMNRDDPFRHLYLTAHNTAYNVHPYKDPVIGYENLLRGLTRDDLLTYYKGLYVPNNISLVVVGDFDAGEALPKIQEAFRDFDRESITPVVVPQEPLQMGPRERIEEFDVKVAQSLLGFHGPSLSSDDLYPMDVLAIVLGGGDTSRLYRELRERQGIVYSISAWSATPRDPGMFWISSFYEPENHKAVQDAIGGELKKLRAEGVSEEELETARAKVLSGYIFSRETVEGQARSLGSGEMDAHDIFFDRRYVESIRHVTAQDVHDVLEKYFKPENLVTATLMPAGTRAAGGVTAEEQEEAQKTARVEKTTLPNGFTLLTREDHSTETVSLRLFVLGGARAETRANTGVTNLMSKAMLKGTDERSAEEIAREIESRGGSIGSFSGYNSMGFEVDMLSRDLDIGIEILADVVATPSFPDEEVEREKALALAEIKTVGDEIFPSSMKLFRETMFKNHPYSFHVKGNAEAVQSITPQDLREFHSETVVGSRMVLSVFGDFDISHILESVQEKFGGLDGGLEFSGGGETDPFEGALRQAFRPMKKEQLAILIGFPGVTVADPARYPLEVLSNFLSSQGGKLFQTLRDERGLAYSVGAFNILGVEPGAFVLYIMTEPEKAEEAIGGMLEVMTDVRENGLDKEELGRTKVEVTGKHAIEMQTNAQIATQVSFDELYGLGHNEYMEYDARINGVSSEDIRRVAMDMFDFNRYTLIAVGDLGSEQHLQSAIVAVEERFGIGR